MTNDTAFCVFAFDQQAQIAKCTTCGRTLDLSTVRCKLDDERKVEAAASRLAITAAEAARFAKAMVRWGLHGFPSRSDADVQMIYETICGPCEYNVDDRCKLCGCCVNKDRMALRNKIRMATEVCPKAKWPDDPRHKIREKVRDAKRN